MNHLNPHGKKIKKSYLMEISCGHCKDSIALYQKVGRGNLLIMYHERIISGALDFGLFPSEIICPNCKEKLGSLFEENGKKAYRMIRSTYNTTRKR